MPKALKSNHEVLEFFLHTVTVGANVLQCMVYNNRTVVGGSQDPDGKELASPS